MYWYRGHDNVGDALSPLIVAHLSGRDILHVPKQAHCKLVSTGSVLHNTRAGDVVWGSGALSPENRIRSTRIDVRAVRGPLTRKELLRRGVDCPEIYGDPGILLPRLFPVQPPSVRPFALGIVPHYKDKGAVEAKDPRVKVIDVETPPEKFVAELASCERVVASSLHGVILAEAYGIPADWVILSDQVTGGNFKFHDYYLGTGREPPEPLTASSLLFERDWTPPRFNREGLLAAFPFPAGADLKT